MKIVWDEPKRLANLAKHRMNFADLNEGFFDQAFVLPALGNRRVGDAVPVLYEPVVHLLDEVRIIAELADATAPSA